MIVQIMMIIAAVLMLLGIWGLLSRRHLIKIILGFSLLDTGIHILLVAIGYRKDGTAPIFDADLAPSEAVARAVDPVPSALVLTAIVIGLAVTALMLSYAVKMFQHKRSLMIDRNRELKW
jgi:multisubunit Na+/H+ antiporter MnhC subunit